MSNIENETQKIMKKYNIKADKSLGQNFLIDDNAVEKIVEASNITKEDLVIEIGPGLGTLTERLLQKAGKVICVEIDTRMIKILNDRFGALNNFQIINEDILKVDLNKLIEQEKTDNIKKAKVVANLPYYITTPIVMKLLEENVELESITVMVQKEVAKRLSAIPGEKETGAITYGVYYYAEAEEIIEVPRTSFIPEPEVTSEVIKLNIRKEKAIQIKNIDLMFKIIKIAFSQRRKTLLNALTNNNIINTKEEGKKLLESLNLKENVRGEELSIEQYAQLSEFINIKL